METGEDLFVSNSLAFLFVESGDGPALSVARSWLGSDGIEPRHEKPVGELTYARTRQDAETEILDW